MESAITLEQTYNALTNCNKFTYLLNSGSLYLQRY